MQAICHSQMVMMKCPGCGFELRGRPKKLPLRQARDGCIRIAENIKCFTEGGIALMFFPGGFCRMPYILAILGMDEAGKVLKIIRECVKAEDSSPETVLEIENWYAHWAKGSAAGDMGAFTVDWLDRILRSDAFMIRDGKLKDQDLLDKCKAHLKHLSRHFADERNSIIYVDYEEEGEFWSIPGSPDAAVVLFDLVLLSLLSDIVVKSLGSGKSFMELDKAMRGISACAELQDALGRLDRSAGTSLSRTLKNLKE